MVYIDPPFATHKEFHGNAQERAYQDKVLGARFIEFVRKRLILLRELLAPSGSLYVHLDWRKSHYIRAILDEVFGENRFVSEIIWQRHDPHNDAVTRYGRVHDVIFWYATSDRPAYNYADIVEELSVRAIKEYNLVELPDGQIIAFDGQDLPFGARRFKLDDCTVKGQNPSRKFEWRKARPSPKRQWPFDSPLLMDKAVEDGILYLRNPNKGAARCRKSYLDDRLRDGQLAQDIWLNLGRMKGGSSYPTEKPELLLDRIVRASSNSGDIVLDAFAGSGTTCAVAEKLGRRWIGIDCGKLAIYTIQKRMLSLKGDIGQKGKPLAPQPFTLYNAGLYDFSTLRDLPWQDWRFFALQLFGCRDELHTIGGLALDGKRQGASVLVFNHLAQPGSRIDVDTIQSIHAAVGGKVGNRFFVIAPRGVFDFQQDYIDLDDVRYYALRIPYSFINELHQREFSALKQPADETDVNAVVDAVGFDFIRPPQVTWTAGVAAPPAKDKHSAEVQASYLAQAFVHVVAFESRATIRGQDTRGGLETLSLVLIDIDYNGEQFVADHIYFAADLKANDWRMWLPPEGIGAQNMMVFIDLFGNEAREIVTVEQFGMPAQTVVSIDSEPLSA